MERFLQLLRLHIHRVIDGVIYEGGSKNLVNLVIFALARKSSLKFYFLKIEVVRCNVTTGCVLVRVFLGLLRMHRHFFSSSFFLTCI